jgi:broad specificity phosphatase PhoE
MTTLLLVRHGESVANGKSFFAGHLDIDLSQLGYKQAECTAEYIVKNYSVDVVYSSDLQRAYHTAEPIAKMTGALLKKEEALREIYAGDWQGLTFDELQSKYADSYGVWLTDIGRAACINGETVKELYERVWNVLQKILNENMDKTVVIVTHATPIRAICCRLMGKSVEEMKNVAWVSNASITQVIYNGGEWSIKEKSIDRHLADMLTKFPPNV